MPTRPATLPTADRGPVGSEVPRADRATLVTVDAAHAGQRLDNFLMHLARDVPKSHLYRIVRSGEVRINRARAQADQRVEAGDVVRVPPLQSRSPGPRPSAPATMPAVLFEDEHLVVVDKPAGLAVHGGSGIAHGVIERVRAARPHLPLVELAHRLDRETSGVLLLAKSRRALLGLHAAMRDGTIDKRYLVLVRGDWVNERQHVRLALRKAVTRTGERRVSVDDDGQEAHTIFELRQRYGVASLLEAQLRTGRTHQIRVHLAHLGFPIVGDDKYGDFELNRAVARGGFAAAAPVRLDRMFLHAARLGFDHPVSGEALQIEAPLPPECVDFLKALDRA